MICCLNPLPLLLATVCMSVGVMSFNGTINSATTSVEAANLVHHMLKTGEQGPALREYMDKMTKKSSLQDAAKTVKHKLPAAVARLVEESARLSEDPATTVDPATFSEVSMAKARKVLNDLILAGMRELDNLIIDCHEFEEKNRGTFDQVETDLARIAEEIAEHERLRAEGVENVNTATLEMISITESMRVETSAFKRQNLIDKAEMALKQNDMDVFQFMLEITKCKELTVGGNFLQRGAQPQICESSDGLVLNFGDRKLQAKYERLMTPRARREIQAILGGVPVSLLQQPSGNITDMIISPDTEPVQKQVDAKVGWLKCAEDKVPDCGLLHDKMSLLWGDYKDLVDKLQHEMDVRVNEFTELMTNLNEQMGVMRNMKTRFSLQVSEATGNINSKTEETLEKESERRVLEEKYEAQMQECMERMFDIMHQDICSYYIIRGKVMKHSTTCPPEKTTDCAVEDWIPGDCSVPCDDKCPDLVDPTGCGGKRMLRRGIIVRNNECGYECLALTRQNKCNQIRCPVDCVQSEWSDFSACTRECGGGVHIHARSTLTKPKDGGQSCGNIQETEVCHVGTCDRDCTLKKWTEWSPCSQACGGGMQEREKGVLIEMRGNGVCPAASSSERAEERGCNQHACNGDEVCVAIMDLIIAIDGSGSVQVNGFEAIRDFTVELIDKYMHEWMGREGVRIGVIQFGNGEILADGSITPAIEVTPMTDDFEKVKTDIKALTHKAGFTNMAQAFTLADNMFTRDSRGSASSAVMTITDGKPSFAFQTRQEVDKLKEKGIQMYFAPIEEFEGEELELMKSWASAPWENNLVHIPGLAALEASANTWKQEFVQKFCPSAVSPATMFQVSVQRGFKLFREYGLCKGAEAETLLDASRTTYTAEKCAGLAEAAGFESFTLGAFWRTGTCRGEKVKFNIAEYDAMGGAIEPACPAGSSMKFNMYYDHYAIEPISVR